MECDGARDTRQALNHFFSLILPFDLSILRCVEGLALRCVVLRPCMAGISTCRPVIMSLGYGSHRLSFSCNVLRVARHAGPLPGEKTIRQMCVRTPIDCHTAAAHHLFCFLSVLSFASMCVAMLLGRVDGNNWIVCKAQSNLVLARNRRDIPLAGP